MKAERVGLVLLAGGVVFCAATSARSQDAVMRTASPLEAGAIRLALHPVVLPEGDDELGVAGRAELGFSERLALLSRFAFYNDLGLVSAQAVYSLSAGGEPALALVGGLHRIFPEERGGYFGLDLGLLASGELGDDVAVFGSLDLDREFPPAPFSSITRIHLVGGVELAVSERVHALVEVGLGLGDDSPNYLSAGLAWRLD
jgi:hypothetical protein